MLCGRDGRVAFRVSSGSSTTRALCQKIGLGTLSWQVIVELRERSTVPRAERGEVESHLSW